MTAQSTLEQEQSDIFKILQAFTAGASLEEIQSALALPLERRTLQRRLARLVETGQIIIKGKGRATRYVPSAAAASTDDSIPLSAEAQSIRTQVNRPKHQRMPVGYNLDFLESYQPNVTFYLSQQERAHLVHLGKTDGMTQNNKLAAGTYAKHILQRLLIDLSWNSSRLEGNTYSLLETERLLALGEAAAGKPALDAQMILNHKDAIEFLVESAEDIGFNRYTILNLHALLANNLLPDPQAPGRLRFIEVGIGGSVFEPLGIPQRINDAFDLILQKASRIENPFEQAFFAMVQLPYLQPFDGVNKRVSRLAAKIPLLKHNLAPLSFVEMPESLYIQGMLGVYELNQPALLKDVFLWAYTRSAARYAAIRQNITEPDPFRLKYRDKMQALIHAIISQMMTRSAAAEAIKTTTAKLPVTDQARFTETVETDLLSLHEGNFARYRVSLRAFQEWQRQW
jgi:Fic family protein